MTTRKPGEPVIAGLTRHRWPANAGDPGLREDDDVKDAQGWSVRALQAAPHRLSFFLAMVVLVASGIWWALLQVERITGAFGFGYDLAPSVVHATLMTFGAMPLFFCGFLFTAGPKWLGVAPPTVRDVRTPLLAMAIGWLAWPVASHINAMAAAAALAVALFGLASVTWRFWGLVRRSQAQDRLHAKTIAAALLAGCLSLAGVGASVLLDDPMLGRAFAQSGLWGFIVVVYVAVAHRMIPFFTSSALPMISVWRPFWVLGLLLGVCVFEGAAVWIDMATDAAAWHGIRGALEVTAGGVLVWLAFAWGLVQSLRIRLVAMLHLGFSWLGVGLALMGASHLVSSLTGEEWLPLGGLHAVTMGCLGSLMVAMVTRVSAGHSGRALVADNLVWALFLLLQAAVFARLAAAAFPEHMLGLAATAALLWAGVLTVWGVRYGNWYGRPRADGRPG
jgi:uncharacterized protein involved in response to NO